MASKEKRIGENHFQGSHSGISSMFKNIPPHAIIGKTKAVANSAAKSILGETTATKTPKEFPVAPINNIIHKALKKLSINGFMPTVQYMTHHSINPNIISSGK